MSRIICTLIICYTAVTYYPFSEHCKHCHGTNKRGIMETATGVGCPAESGKDQVGARNCAASGNEESPAANGMP